MNEIATAYVKLVLEIDLYAPGYIDAYYGPQEWRSATKEECFPQQRLQRQTDELITQLAGCDVTAADAITQRRKESLAKQLRSVKTKIAVLAGEKLSFDDESLLFYDAVAPRRSDDYFDSILAALDRALPGRGAVAQRFSDFTADFTIPAARVDGVLRAAAKRCGDSTRARIAMPARESFELNYVSGVNWSGYNWYKGDGHSLIEINTDLPLRIDDALHLIAHEIYPGHHLYGNLLEDRLYRGRGWSEFSVYPMASPQSLLFEGSANYGTELVMSPTERLAFNRDELFPLAGLDGGRVEELDAILELSHGLKYLRTEVARAYADGRFDREQAFAWLSKYSLGSAERIRKQLAGAIGGRSYINNYSLGEDMIKAYVERGAAGDRNRMWHAFEELLSTPHAPSSLLAAEASS